MPLKFVGVAAVVFDGSVGRGRFLGALLASIRISLEGDLPEEFNGTYLRARSKIFFFISSGFCTARADFSPPAKRSCLGS